MPEAREAILSVAQRHGIRRVRLFGSAARGEATSAGDVDLLIDVIPGRSYLDVIAFWQEVEDLLGRRVDVVIEGGISPYLRETILAEAIPL